MGFAKCFYCYEVGHLATYYPKKMSSEVSGTTRRVYALDAQKAKGNNNMIDFTCYMNGQPLFVLFNSGATHSFILQVCSGTWVRHLMTTQPDVGYNCHR